MEIEAGMRRRKGAQSPCDSARLGDWRGGPGKKVQEREWGRCTQNIVCADIFVVDFQQLNGILDGLFEHSFFLVGARADVESPFVLGIDLEFLCAYIDQIVDVDGLSVALAHSGLAEVLRAPHGVAAVHSVGFAKNVALRFLLVEALCV